MAENERSLLSILKGLYSQISQISLGLTQGRLDSYKNDPNTSSSITNILQKRVDDLSSQATSEKKSIATEPVIQKTEENYIKNTNTKETKFENASGVESEFAKHIRQRHPPTVTQPQMGENLKARVWEHINAAIRSAKHGDAETAKLHTNIAGTALEEAGNFMSHDDYSELVLQIESYFAEHSE